MINYHISSYLRTTTIITIKFMNWKISLFIVIIIIIMKFIIMKVLILIRGIIPYFAIAVIIQFAFYH